MTEENKTQDTKNETLNEYHGQVEEDEKKHDEQNDEEEEDRRIQGKTTHQ